MGTRSTIALEFADGTVEEVYCHWDGNIEHNGRILAEHYSDPFKLRELIDLGNLSSLHPSIGEQHNFDHAYEDGCTFYARDRGETDQAADKFWNFDVYRTTRECQQYAYILRSNGVWYVAANHNKFVELAGAVD